MIINYLCPPALLYAVIMLVYLILELSNEKYHQAFVKAIVGIIFTCILQAFCQMNLGVISWTFVMIPIIFYTYITLLTFFMFGVNPKKLDISGSDISSNIIPSVVTPIVTPTPIIPTNTPNKNIDKWLPSKHVSSTPITTSLYTPSFVPIDSYLKKDISGENVPTSNLTSTSSPSSTTSSNIGSSFSYYHPNPSVSVSNKLVPVTLCTRQKNPGICNSLSVCAWTGKDCINTSEFDTRIYNLDVSCSSLSDSSCNYQDNCYLLSISGSNLDLSGNSKCLTSIPSIGELLNNTDCKTLLNKMKFYSATNTTLSKSIDNEGCRSIANKIYSLLV
jgi:hypothetical protein